jgi:hypothetical protein
MATLAASVPIEGKRTAPIYWWATIGFGFFILQVYIFGSWILSDQFTPTDPGPDVMAPMTTFLVYGLQVINVSMGVWIATWWYRSYKRDRAMPPLLIFALGWAMTYWQDPMANLYRLVYVYNSHLFNMGSWVEFIPGWVLPNGHKFPEPLIFQIGGYLGTIPLWCVFMNWIMRKTKERHPAIGIAGLVAVCFAANMLFDLMLEIGFVRTKLYVYTAAIPSLTLFDGNYYQFPLYESLFWGATMAGGSLLLYFRDDKGRFFVERGSEKIVNPTSRTFLRILAVGGLLNLIYLLYNMLMWFASFHAGPMPQIDSYLSNGICGPGTSYECPAPGVPVPTPGGATQPAVIQ